MDGLDETRPLLAPPPQDAASSTLTTSPGMGEKKKRTPLPKLQIGIVMLLHLSEPMSAHCIFPFINQLISELDITGGDEKKVGYYAGMIESIFFATEALFVFQWARLSDHIGRKPVLLIGLFGLTISMACFGLSKTFLGLVVSRSIVGMLNGNTGVMKSVIAELTDSTNMAQGFACIPVSWAIGATMAPMIGGQLAKPADRWPHIFTHPFWKEYPYFLPCAVSAAFCGFCFLTTAIFFKETLKRRRRSGTSCSESPDGSRSGSPNNVTAVDDAPPPLRTVLTRPVMLSIANYGALALADIAFIAFLPLFLSTPIHLGGLGLSPAQIGIILGSLGVLDGLFQALFFAPAVDTWGAKRVYQVGLATFVPLYALFPAMNMLARASGGVTTAVWGLVLLQLGIVCIMDLAFGVVFMYVTSSAPSSRSLGAVNGIAQFVASVMRAIGPAASTSLFASSLEYNWLGGNFGYVVLVTMSVGIFFVSRPLPDSTWPKTEEDEE